MIEPENLHSLLVEHDKTDRDLIRYVCNGLHAYDINEIEVFPVEKKLKAECVDLKGNIDWSMEAIQELKKFDAMNRDELLELTAAIRPDPEVSIYEEVEALVTGSRTGHGLGIALKIGFVSENYLTEDLERSKNRLNDVIILKDKISRTDRKDAPIELREIISAVGTAGMDDLADRVAECYYEPEEISKHINADAETSIEKDLPLYLDPNHPKFSSEVAIVFHYIRELYEEKIKFDAGGSKIEQLIFIIQKDYPNLSQKAMDRIATVILPDSQRRLPQKGRTAKKYTK